MKRYNKINYLNSIDMYPKLCDNLFVGIDSPFVSQLTTHLEFDIERLTRKPLERVFDWDIGDGLKARIADEEI